MFKPELLQIQDTSITQKIRDSIKESYSFLHRDLYGNIVCGGGNTMFEGFTERLTKELSKDTDYKFKIVKSSEGNNSSWIGASIVSSLSTFTKIWISKEEYEEYGSKFIEFKTPCTFNFYPKRNTKLMKEGIYELFQKKKDVNITFGFH